MLFLPDDCLYLSGIDILDGTPVLDIKPYILQYDAPSSVIKQIDDVTDTTTSNDIHKSGSHIQNSSSSLLKNATQNMKFDLNQSCLNCNNENMKETSDQKTDGNLFTQYSDDNASITLRNDCETECVTKINREESSNLYQHKEKHYSPTCTSQQSSEKDTYCSSIQGRHGELGVVAASWVKSPPIASLTVCFNPIAENQVTNFSSAAEDVGYR